MKTAAPRDDAFRSTGTTRSTPAAPATPASVNVIRQMVVTVGATCEMSDAVPGTMNCSATT